MYPLILLAVLLTLLAPQPATLLALASPTVLDVDPASPTPASKAGIVVGALLVSFLLVFTIVSFLAVTRQHHRPLPLPRPASIPLSTYHFSGQAPGAPTHHDQRDIGPDSSASTISFRVSGPSPRGSVELELELSPPPAVITSDQVLLSTHRQGYERESTPSVSGSDPSSGGSAPPSPLLVPSTI